VAEIPENIRSIVSNYIENLGKDIHGVRWERPEKIHITLRFLGDLEEDTVAGINDNLSKFIEQREIESELSGLGGFPDLRFPRILFIGLEENIEIENLKINVDKCLNSMGFPPEEREFIPHLTIGRVKQRIRLPRDIPPIKSPGFIIRNVTVFRSVLKRSGSKHIPLKRLELK